MPELPEVETVRRRLEPVLVGRRFDHVEIADARLTRPEDPVEVAAELIGERVAAVERRGKYLIVRFESGRVLLIHLRMTGNVLHASGGSFDSDAHRRAVVNLDDGSAVAYRDVRRFGTWLLLEAGELDAYLAPRLGAEPLGRTFTTKVLAARLETRKAPIKAALLDQRTLAGLGTSTSTKRSGARASTRCDRPASSTPPSSARSAPRSPSHSRPASPGRGRRSATTASPTGRAAACRSASRSTAAGESRAPAAARRSTRSASRAAGRGTARPASASRRN